MTKQFVGDGSPDGSILGNGNSTDIFSFSDGEPSVKSTITGGVTAGGPLSQLLNDFNSKGLVNDQTTTGTAPFGIFGLIPRLQQISTDGGPSTEVLLESNLTSLLRVQNDNTSHDPNEVTVGMESGVFDGQFCYVNILELYALEIDPDVQNSADIVFENNVATKKMQGYRAGLTTTSSALFIWRTNDSKWYEITLTPTA